MNERGSPSATQADPHREVAGHDALPQVELQRTRTRSWPEFVARFLVFLAICGFGRLLKISVHCSFFELVPKMDTPPEIVGLRVVHAGKSHAVRHVLAGLVLAHSRSL